MTAEEISIADGLRRVRERVAQASVRSGRPAEAVRLISVCKRQNSERVIAALRAGAEDLGESTVQGLEATAQHAELAQYSFAWHFVGMLQRRKVRRLLPFRPFIHSVDRLDLAVEISTRATAAEPIDVLLQVNMGQEEQKGGADPAAVVDLAVQLASLPGLRLRGLMTIPPLADNPSPHFGGLQRLADEVRALPGCAAADQLSMGMSNDFEEAIACGATMVRVGTSIFGERW